MAAGIARAVRRKVETVGVFVNQPLDEIADLRRRARPHPRAAARRRGPVVLPAVAQRTGAKVIKAVRIGHAADLRDLERFHTDFHLLDTAAGRRTTAAPGSTWDWTLLAQRRNKIPLILLAGGLTPENVADGDRAPCEPWGVDVASRRRVRAAAIKDPDEARGVLRRRCEIARPRSA